MSLFKHFFSKALETQLTITSSNGFHLRPVAQFSTLAKTFPCNITAIFQGNTVDAKSVNTLLSLSLEKNNTFTLHAKGKQSSEAIHALKTLFETLMQNDIQIKSMQKESSPYAGIVVEGDIIFKGIAIAPAYAYEIKEIQHKSDVSFKKAIEESIHELEALYLYHKKEDKGNIYLAQKELLLSLEEKSENLSSLELAVIKEIETLRGGKLESKKADYRDILQRVKKHLGLERKVYFPHTPFILLADDLLPGEIDALSKTEVCAVILKETSLHSHTAILLRAAGIASLIVKSHTLPSNKTLILDADAGVVLASPSEEDLKKAQIRLEQVEKRHLQSAKKRFEPAKTTQGQSIKVLANVADKKAAQLAKDEGAEGIGLLRSEFLFKTKKPSLKRQEKAYAEIFALFEDITVRTLDVGGDKALPYIKLPQENNPFLGIRGVRLFKSHPILLEEQLLAIFKAAGEKYLKIMFPMVSTVEEFVEAKSFAKYIAEKNKLDISHISFGIMIEVPSVLFLLEAFNEVVDFYSIGTNDLTQYLFAVERTHPLLKVDALSPVVFSAIETIVKQAKKPLSICGELAANSDAIEKLVNLGLTTLSVSPKSVAQTKEIIRHV